jgi:hypothetical protein
VRAPRRGPFVAGGNTARDKRACPLRAPRLPRGGLYVAGGKRPATKGGPFIAPLLSRMATRDKRPLPPATKALFSTSERFIFSSSLGIHNRLF